MTNTEPKPRPATDDDVSRIDGHDTVLWLSDEFEACPVCRLSRPGAGEEKS